MKQNDAVLDLRRFDPQRLNELARQSHDQSCNILIVGKRGNGKSCLASHLLQQYKSSLVTVVSYAVVDVYDWSQLRVHPGFYEEIFEDILAEQRSAAQYRQNKEFEKIKQVLNRVMSRETVLPPELVELIGQHVKNAIGQHLPLAALVVEDCVLHTKAVTSKVEKYLCHQVHPKLLTILVSQGGNQFLRPFRNSMHFVFIFPSATDTYKRSLYGQWGSVFPTFAEFCTVLDAMPRCHCLVIDRTDASKNLRDSVFWYEAPAPCLLEYIKDPR